MKEEYWKLVKAGDYFILANTLVGVKRARVIEVDVKILEEFPTTRYAWPYGKTKDTGIVKIRYDSTEEIQSLKDLITYNSIDLHALQKIFKKYEGSKATTEAYEDAFNAKIQELIQL